VTEARNADDEEFGRDRLIECVGDKHGDDPVGVRDALLAAVRAFTSTSPQADDLTVLVLRHRGAP
jgi:serine phosphatase RsbU (regulator of sigma subunit)